MRLKKVFSCWCPKTKATQKRFFYDINRGINEFYQDLPLAKPTRIRQKSIFIKMKKKNNSAKQQQANCTVRSIFGRV